MNDQTVRFRIGIFVLGTLILLAVLIILFGGFPNYFKAANTYTITFTNAPGVSRGTPVRRSGVKIGEVRSVKLDNDTGKVHVQINVDPAYTLRKGDKATLVQSLLGADTAIDFLPPREGAVDVAAVEPGSTLEGQGQPDPGTLLQKTTDLMPSAKDAMDEMKKVFQKFDKFSPLMEETLKEYKELAKATRDIIP